MSELAALLGRMIRDRGPIDVGAYMQLVMGHPTLGYYATRDPFGREGDFVTAPEISQIFGELLGLALAQRWLDLGSPGRFRLVEMGPGRGTLMADAWRATGIVPGFHYAAQLHLVETSRHLRSLQAARLPGVAVQWHDALAEIPDDAPLLLLANELLDALPVRQFERALPGWRERVVTLAADDSLAFATAADRTPFHGTLMQRHAGAPLGAVIELSPAREAVAAEIATRLATHGGLALLIDYGSRRLDGPTLQAVRGHATANPLETPGEADVSAHVDFGTLAETAIAGGAMAWGPLAQGELLLRLGAEARLARLTAGQPAEQAKALRGAGLRLIDPAQMGALFQVLALTGAGTAPPGFTDEERYRP
jgi:NADH dehydrogenase [ubiquinone] 1 alpha subcomplex assembly factor 7